MKNYLIIISACLAVSACSSQYRSISENIDGDKSSSNSRYAVDKDSLPEQTLTADQIKEIQPKNEPLSAGGNKDYEVWGKKYQVLDSSAGYSETGVASWYGAKFHNHKTSNGETYDMYQLSAAHKSLPLPTYLKVTNLDNGLNVIVRVNDRGPFHEDRLIDLSYAAAVKLDFINSGTARVKIETVNATKAPIKQSKPKAVEKPIVQSNAVATPAPKPIMKEQSSNSEYFLQLAAFKDKPSAQNYAEKVKIYSLLINERLFIESADLHRVKVGPLSQSEATQLKTALQSVHQIRAFLLFE